MELSLFMKKLIVPAIILIVGLIVGWLVQRIILNRLRRFARHTKWRGDEAIIDALHGYTFLWIFLIGLYASIRSFPLLSPVHFPLIQKSFVIIFIASFTIFLAKLTNGFINIYNIKGDGALHTTTIFTSIIRILIYLIGLLIILQSMGIAVTPLLTALGVGGLAVALALQETLSNLFAGIHIIASKQITPGNYIRLESGEEGYINDISWRNTTIRTLPNNLVIVPNSKMASVIITNYNAPEPEMSFLIQVGVAYGSDLEKVERITVETARETLRSVEGGVGNFDPFIRYHTFGDFSINFSVILRCKEFVNQYLIKHEFIKQLYRRFQEEAVTIPFPIREVLVKKMDD